MVEVFFEALVRKGMLAPLFMTASETNTLWCDLEFEEKLTQLWESYSGELMTEADGALRKTAAAIIHAKARQTSKQILHNYTCVGDINDAAIEQLDVPSAEVVVHTMEQKAQPTRQQTLASPPDYAVNGPGLQSPNHDIGEPSIPIYDDQTGAAESLDEEFGNRDSVYQIQEFTGLSNAFRHLRSSLRQLLVPDMMKAIRQEVVLNLKPVSDERYGATFSVCWEAQRYINQEFETGQAFGSVLTVTGNAKHAYATSCVEYMSWNWPKTGPAMLETIQTAVQAGTCCMLLAAAWIISKADISEIIDGVQK